MKEVLLYSGGMDSFVLSYMHPEAMLLYIDSGAEYTVGELERLHKFAPRPVTVIRGALDLSKWEREDAIVPARNLFLVTIASFYGDRVLLGSTDGDNSTDKDDRFCYISADLLSHIYDCDHFPDRGQVQVEAPAKAFTKFGLVQWLKAMHPEKVQDMIDTLSCYDPQPGGKHCGKCKACVRKWTALQAALIDWWPEHGNPCEYDWAPIIDKIRRGFIWRSEAEDYYTMQVLTCYGVDI